MIINDEWGRSEESEGQHLEGPSSSAAWSHGLQEATAAHGPPILQGGDGELKLEGSKAAVGPVRAEGARGGPLLAVTLTVALLAAAALLLGVLSIRRHGSSETCLPYFHDNICNHINCSAYAKPPKSILLWNSFHGNNLGYESGLDAFATAGCSQCDCFMTEARGLMAPEHFDAVVVHTKRIPAGPRRILRAVARSWHQRYIFFLNESPSYSGGGYETLSHVFNWTMTYRADSDVFAPYGEVVPLPGVQAPAGAWLQPLAPPAPPSATFARLADRPVRNEAFDENQPAVVAWLVSHCYTKGRREARVKELAKYLKVDIFGWCGKPWPRNDTVGFYKMLSKNYMFYLSYENSVCRDYVTEKLFKVLPLNVVPVVYGGANYSAVLPPHSYIDARAFPSERHLAAYLRHLQHHLDEFAKFFWWRRFYEVRSNPLIAFCRLCAKLHAPSAPASYAHMDRWWNEPGICHNPPPAPGDETREENM